MTSEKGNRAPVPAQPGGGGEDGLSGGGGAGRSRHAAAGDTGGVEAEPPATGGGDRPGSGNDRDDPGSPAIPGRRASGKAASRSGRIGRPRGPRRSRDERRAELLDAAERAIRRIGPQASMDELAAEAGITKPILYSHFGDKAGLAAALTERVAAELESAITASLGRLEHPEQVVSSTIDAFCSFIETETELYHFLWYAALNSPDRTGTKTMMVGFANQIAYALGTALRQVGADSGAAEPWSFAIVGMTLSAGEWWLERRMMSREDLVAYLTQLLWGGLAGAGLDRLADTLGLETAGASPLTPETGTPEPGKLRT